MTEILTESFCERCGTRYTFETASHKARPLSRLSTLGRGIRHYLATEDASLDESMAVARSDDEQRAATAQLEAFHRTFNFCLSCRQYTCTECWNPVEGRCTSCAPLPETATIAPAVTLGAPVLAMLSSPVADDSIEIRPRGRSRPAEPPPPATTTTPEAPESEPVSAAEAPIATPEPAEIAETAEIAEPAEQPDAETRRGFRFPQPPGTEAPSDEAWTETEPSSMSTLEPVAEETTEAVATEAEAFEPIFKPVEPSWALETESAVAEPAAAAEPEAEAVEPAAAAEPEPAAAEPEAEALEPAAAAEPEPAAAEPEAEAVEPAAAAEPEPAAVEPFPSAPATATPAIGGRPATPYQGFQPGRSLDDEIAAYERQIAELATAQPKPDLPPITVTSMPPADLPIADRPAASAPTPDRVAPEPPVARRSPAPPAAPARVVPSAFPAADLAGVLAATQPPSPKQPAVGPVGAPAPADLAPIPASTDLADAQASTDLAGGRAPTEATPLHAVGSCRNCGLSISTSARFCRRCGTRQHAA